MKKNKIINGLSILFALLTLYFLYTFITPFRENYENNTVYCFWTGTNEMSEKRRDCFEKLKEISECRIILVTPENLDEYILPEHPLHQAYPYLSETHKADYLRTYFMHFYGGGYSDIKTPSGSWKSAFSDLQNRDNVYINGYRELSPGDIAAPEVSKHYSSLIGNCAYIVKPGTDFTKSWYGAMLKTLDEKLDRLKQNPATYPQEKAEDGNGYPIEWNEMLGRIFHKKLIDIQDNILFTVPRPIMMNYR